MSDRKDILRGTLDLMILRIISNGPMHGWGVMQRLRHLTDDTFQVTPGSLFPPLRRLEENGWASSHWDRSENNRKARYYSITKAGRKQLASETQNWQAIMAAVQKVVAGGMRRLWFRLVSMLRRLNGGGASEADFTEEFRSFVEHDTPKIRSGMSPEDAHRAALIELGGAEQVKECVREDRAGARWAGILRDTRYAVRSLGQAGILVLADR